MSNFIYPCQDVRLTSPFGKRNHPVTGLKNQMHWGIDLAKTGHVPIYASASGKVSRTSNEGELGRYGNFIMIVHTVNGKVCETVYAHLKTMVVKLNQKVDQGQLIGYMGNTGVGTGQHLHFEIHIGGRRNMNNTYAVNPLLQLTDSKIKVLQSLLNKVGYKLVEDGINGESTQKALMDFQKKNGLVSDGIAGDKTITKLQYVINSKSTTPLPSTEKLKWGKTELKKGQIGKITIIKPINLYQDDVNGELKMERILKPTEEYRVYNYREDHGGQYDVGSGMWITNMEGYVKYETPSKSMLEKLKNL